MLIFYKQVDQSVLKEGLSIPITYQQLLQEELSSSLPRGLQITVEVDIDGQIFQVVLRNQKFDSVKYPEHTDILQLRYAPKSDLAACIRQKFSYTSRLIAYQKAMTGSTRVSKIEEDKKEYIAVYSTPIKNRFLFDCICNNELMSEVNELKGFGEITAESILEGIDATAGIEIRTKDCKIRKLSRTIGNDLKQLYKYRCQICGKYIGENYGSNLIHAHHIEYFTKSLNNNVSNILIVCPNHHGIIHDKNPEFNRKKLTYKYPNGFEEGLLLNQHLF